MTVLIPLEFGRQLIISLYVICSRNQAYQARVQLAVLDYNAHLGRDKAKNKAGDIIYNRKFRKQSKKWDATPTLKQKEYIYIPELMEVIKSQHVSSCSGLKKGIPSRYDHPSTIQSTIANTPPASTNDIVRKKQSRFDNN